MQIQKNFKYNEFVYSRDVVKPSTEQIINIYKTAVKLQELRDIVDSIDVTSGFRSVPHNRQVGGSRNSHHLNGLAVDIKFDFGGWTDKSLLKLFTGLGWTNIGIYKRGSNYAWIHLDIADKRWNEYDGWYHIKDSAVKFYKV